MTSRNCSGVSRVAGTAVPTPALLTRMSTRPNCSIAASTSAVARLRVGDVGGDGDRAPAGALRPALRLLEPVGAAGAEHDVGAGLGQRLRERHAEARRGAGHDRDSTVEPEPVEDGGLGAHGTLLRLGCSRACGDPSGPGEYRLADLVDSLADPAQQSDFSQLEQDRTGGRMY